MTDQELRHTIIIRHAVLTLAQQRVLDCELAFSQGVASARTQAAKAAIDLTEILRAAGADV